MKEFRPEKYITLWKQKDKRNTEKTENLLNATLQ